MVKIILENTENKRSNIKSQSVRGLKERLGRKIPRDRRETWVCELKVFFIT